MTIPEHKIVRTYVGKGEALNGVPAQSITAEEWEQLPRHLQLAVDASPFYQRAKNSPPAVTAESVATEPAPVAVVEPTPAIVVEPAPEERN